MSSLRQQPLNVKDESYTDDVLAMDVDTNADGNPDQLFFFGKDFNNNVTIQVDTNGILFEYYAYDSFSPPEI